MNILPTILVISMLLFFFSKISCATDTITQSQPLLDGSTLISKGEVFELGFFNPGNSNNRYVGIWYKNIPDKRVVWVANRDNPIKDNSGKLIISQGRLLSLVDKNQSLLWSTNTTTKVSNPIVQLLDNGNLVLKNDGEENFLWQSFDHPCDTILSEMKVGWDKKRGLARNLTAWKNWDDPSSGEFTSAMILTPNPESFIFEGSTKIFRTGPWTGSRSSGVTSGIIGFQENPLFDYEFVNNENEVYYKFTLKNSSVVSIIVMNQSLSLRQRLVWIPESKTWGVYSKLPQDSCDAYNVCGANGQCALDASPMCQCLDGFKPKSPQQWNGMDWRGGCVRNGNWSCGVKKRDGFKKFVGIKLPDTTHSWIDEKMTLEDCKAKCLKNCSCSAYSSLDSTRIDGGCSLWFGDLIDLRVLQRGNDVYVRVDASDIGDGNGHKKMVELVVSTTVPVVFVILLAFTYIYIKKAKYKEKIEKITRLEEKEEDTHGDFELPIYDQATILKATNNFSFNNKLGEGGFGPVYKGILLDGQEIAVKRLSKSSGQGSKEFKNEVILCAKLQHRNLVKVVGCCIEGDEKILIYEYMSNNSLDSFLFDFGLARMCGGDQIEGRTNKIVGTYGYMAPEYAIDGLFSIKSDVFSYGVLLLEIISGKKNRARSYREHDHNLIGYAWRLWKEGIPLKLVDDNIRDSCIEFEAIRCIQIALLCVQHHPDDRPNMTSVVVMLNSENTLPIPKEPGFLIKMFSTEGEPSSGKEISSTNEVTISLLEAR
ncbi:receptor protein-tyrosine kinase [Trifolium repens]|nr:receptor protein-tyrosine kinase [Trifolium repens]